MKSENYKHSKVRILCKIKTLKTDDVPTWSKSGRNLADFCTWLFQHLSEKKSGVHPGSLVAHPASGSRVDCSETRFINTIDCFLGLDVIYMARKAEQTDF